MDILFLEDCCEILDSMRVPITASDRKEGKYPYYGANGIQGHVSDYIFDDELVLLAEDGGNYGSKDKPIAYRVSGKCWVNNHAHVLKPKEGLDVDYLCYSLMFYKVEGMINGATRQKLTQAAMKKMRIPIRDINEQQQIVAELNCIVGIKEQRLRELKLLDDLIKARFVELFGNPEQNEKGWRTCRLGDECTVINGRAYKAEELLDEGKYRVLRVGNFFTNDSWYYSDLELDNDKYCDEGDLLFAWSASFGPRIWHGEKVIYHYHIWKLIGYENCLNKEFFVELLNYNCDVMKRGTHGSTMLHFTKSQMEDQLLILPPMQLQEQFADFVHQIDKSKSAYFHFTIHHKNAIIIPMHCVFTRVEYGIQM